MACASCLSTAVRTKQPQTPRSSMGAHRIDHVAVFSSPTCIVSTFRLLLAHLHRARLPSSPRPRASCPPPVVRKSYKRHVRLRPAQRHGGHVSGDGRKPRARRCHAAGASRAEARLHRPPCGSPQDPAAHLVRREMPREAARQERGWRAPRVPPYLRTYLLTYLLT